MQVVIKDNVVIALHGDGQVLPPDAYPGAVVKNMTNAPAVGDMVATSIGDFACAKRLAIAAAAEHFVANLDETERATVCAANPARTCERYPSRWLEWARAQNDLAQVITQLGTASPEQIARAEGVKLCALWLATWTAKVMAEPVAAALAALAAAVAAGDLAAVEAVEPDFGPYRIGATGEGAYPDLDLTQSHFHIPSSDLALITGGAS